MLFLVSNISYNGFKAEVRLNLALDKWVLISFNADKIDFVCNIILAYLSNVRFEQQMQEKLNVNIVK